MIPFTFTEGSGRTALAKLPLRLMEDSGRIVFTEDSWILTFTEGSGRTALAKLPLRLMEDSGRIVFFEDAAPIRLPTEAS
jgi:ABC-type microcin C transport system duplicated ATPase subunit YejF